MECELAVHLLRGKFINFSYVCAERRKRDSFRHHKTNASSCCIYNKIQSHSDRAEKTGSKGYIYITKNWNLLVEHKWIIKSCTENISGTFLFASHLLKSSKGEICFELSQTTIHIKWAWIIRKWGWARAWVEFGSSCMHANWNSFDVNNVWILESWRKTFKLCQPVQIISVCSFFSRVVCVWFWENKKNLFK